MGGGCEGDSGVEQCEDISCYGACVCVYEVGMDGVVFGPCTNTLLFSIERTVLYRWDFHLIILDHMAMDGSCSLGRCRYRTSPELHGLFLSTGCSRQCGARYWPWFSVGTHWLSMNRVDEGVKDRPCLRDWLSCSRNARQNFSMHPGRTKSITWILTYRTTLHKATITSKKMH